MLYINISIKWAYGPCSSKVASIYDFNEKWEQTTEGEAGVRGVTEDRRL